MLAAYGRRVPAVGSRLRILAVAGSRSLFPRCVSNAAVSRSGASPPRVVVPKKDRGKRTKFLFPPEHYDRPRPNPKSKYKPVDLQSLRISRDPDPVGRFTHLVDRLRSPQNDDPAKRRYWEKSNVSSLRHEYISLLHVGNGALRKLQNPSQKHSLLAEIVRVFKILREEFPGGPTVTQYSQLMQSYLSNGSPDKVMLLWQDMKSQNVMPDLTAWNMLIKALADLGQADECLATLRHMQNVRYQPGRSCRPDMATYSITIAAMGAAGRPEKCIDLYEDMRTKQLDLNTRVFSSLIKALCDNGRIGAASYYVEEMFFADVDPDIVILHHLLEAVCNKGDYKQAKRIINKLRFHHVEPDVRAFRLVMHALKISGAVIPALDLHKAVVDNEFGSVTCSAQTYDALLECIGNSAFGARWIHRGAALYGEALGKGFLLPYRRRAGMVDLRNTKPAVVPFVLRHTLDVFLEAKRKQLEANDGDVDWAFIPGNGIMIVLGKPLGMLYPEQVDEARQQAVARLAADVPSWSMELLPTGAPEQSDDDQTQLSSSAPPTRSLQKKKGRHSQRPRGYGNDLVSALMEGREIDHVSGEDLVELQAMLPPSRAAQLRQYLTELGVNDGPQLEKWMEPSSSQLENLNTAGFKGDPLCKEARIAWFLNEMVYPPLSYFVKEGNSNTLWIPRGHLIFWLETQYNIKTKDGESLKSAGSVGRGREERQARREKAKLQLQVQDAQRRLDQISDDKPVDVSRTQTTPKEPTSPVTQVDTAGEAAGEEREDASDSDGEGWGVPRASPQADRQAPREQRNTQQQNDNGQPRHRESHFDQHRKKLDRRDHSEPQFAEHEGHKVGKRGRQARPAGRIRGGEAARQPNRGQRRGRGGGGQRGASDDWW